MEYSSLRDSPELAAAGRAGKRRSAQEHAAVQALIASSRMVPLTMSFACCCCSVVKVEWNGASDSACEPPSLRAGESGGNSGGGGACSSGEVGFAGSVAVGMSGAAMKPECIRCGSMFDSSGKSGAYLPRVTRAAKPDARGGGADR